MTDETPAAPTTMKPSMPDGSGDTPAPWKPSRIAVIAVHGVGHADAGGTVRHLADLLLGLGRLKLPPNPPGHEQVPWNTFSPPYLGFKTQPIQVPLRAAPITGRQTAMQRTVDVSLAHSSRFKRLRSAWLHLWHFLDERRGYIAGIFASNTPPATLKDDLADRARLGHEFMRAQLAGYVSEPDGKSYDTIRLEAARPDDGAPNDRTKDRTVHLYEAYWADLARPQNSILSFMLAFYQLLLHLGSLSRTAIDYAVLEHYEQRSWRWHAFWQSVAVRFLVLPLPILNLYLLLAGLAGLPLKLPWDHCLIAAFVVGAMALAAILYWPTIRNAPRTPWSWMGLLAFAFLLGGIAGYFLALHVMRPNYLLAIEWWLLGGALLYVFVLKPYDDVRRGAARVAQGLYVLCSAAFFYCLWQASGFPYSVDQAGFWTMQILMCGVILSWLGTLLSALFAYALHFICLWNLGGSSQSERLRARAALRTGRLTLAVSASLFLVMTIFLWSGLYAATRQRLNLHAHVQVVPVPLPRPVARVFRAIVPTPSDAIRWTHPADPRPLEIRVTNLEKDNWASSAVCQRVDPAPSSCPPAKPPQPIIPKTALPGICGTPPHRPENGSTTDLPGRLTYLEQQAAVDTTEDRLHPRWMASLDNESRVFRLELRRDKDPQKTLDTYANALMLVSSTAGLHILLICFGLALGLLIWAVVPCLLVDTLSLTDASKFNNRFSRRLGDWYSRGLDSTRAITFLLWHAIFSLAFVFGGLGFAYAHGWMDTAFWLYQRYPCVRPVAATLGRFMQAMTGDTLHVLSVVGASLAVSGAVIATAAYKKGGVVLDIILDVDHYLRTSPLKSAPRARIAERYTSLLRYIAQFKNENGESYDSVVIAAHSLGALISADLLQYLQRECGPNPDLEPELKPFAFWIAPDLQKPVPPQPAFGNPAAEKPSPQIPISLLTFGNPLRQLLNRYFPHLYWWVREEPDNAYNPIPDGVEEIPTISNTVAPDPANHNVRRWVSIYRSGDFVGRSLWLDGWFARTTGTQEQGAYPDELAVQSSPDGSRSEACIGPGGHNNYWDRSAPDMAIQLDNLICGR